MKKKLSKCERFTDGDFHDINGVNLFSELKMFREIIPEGTDTALQALQCVKSLDGSFLNTETTYRIVLTIPVLAA
jgi:hypothetical protein